MTAEQKFQPDEDGREVMIDVRGVALEETLLCGRSLSGQNPAVLKPLNRQFVIALKINQMCYSLARWRPFLLFVICVTLVGFSLALATHCTKMLQVESPV